MADYGYVNILCALCEDAFGNVQSAQKYINRAKEHNPQLRPEKVSGMILTQFDREKGEREYAAEAACKHHHLRSTRKRCR